MSILQISGGYFCGRLPQIKLFFASARDIARGLKFPSLDCRKFRIELRGFPQAVYAKFFAVCCGLRFANLQEFLRPLF